MKRYMTRMGDGFRIEMTDAEIREDINDGIADAADRGNIPPLSQEEIEHLFAIITMPGNMVGVTSGQEIVTTSDSGAFKLSYNANIAMDRVLVAQVHEKGFGNDSVDFGHIDYCYKAVKPVLHDEAAQMQLCLNQTVMPILYGGMTNLGTYTKPDGPVGNWSELLPMGKIDEAIAAQEEAVEHAVRDIVYVAEGMYAVGADGINFDTSGASGDADFLAALKATEIIKERCPNLGVQIGMAGEFVLGMHGKLTYADERLAGLYPHKQVKVCEKAGATIFGAVVNTNTGKSLPWNLARVCTFLKACTDAAHIPVHANVGMGVCAIPMSNNPTIDAVSRIDKALVEIAHVDGL